MIEKDSANFYTYSKDYLSSSFPLVNEHNIAVKQKLESEALWKTPSGFDVHGKKTAWNEHPNKPHQSVLDDLKYSYVTQKAEYKAHVKSMQYRPEDHGKDDFYSKVKNKKNFSDPSYFTTVFISGDDMLKEMAE